MAFVAEELGVEVVPSRSCTARSRRSTTRSSVDAPRAPDPARAAAHPAHAHGEGRRVGRIAALLAGDARPPIVVHTFHGHVLRGYFDPAAHGGLPDARAAARARRRRALVAVSPEVRDDLVALGVAPAEKFIGDPARDRRSTRADRGRRRRPRASCGALFGIAGRPLRRRLDRPHDRRQARRRTCSLAFARLRERGVDATLCLVGDGPDREQRRASARTSSASPGTASSSATSTTSRRTTRSSTRCCSRRRTRARRSCAIEALAARQARRRDARRRRARRRRRRRRRLPRRRSATSTRWPTRSSELARDPELRARDGRARPRARAPALPRRAARRRRRRALPRAARGRRAAAAGALGRVSLTARAQRTSRNEHAPRRRSHRLAPPPPHRTGRGRGGQPGSRTVKVVPRPSSLSAPTEPPIASVSCFTIASPRPGADLLVRRVAAVEVEAVERVLEVLGRDPRAGVGDAHLAGRRRDGDAAARRRRAHRVLDQVREHLQHAVGVGRRRRARRSPRRRATRRRGAPRPRAARPPPAASSRQVDRRAASPRRRAGSGAPGRAGRARAARAAPTPRPRPRRPSSGSITPSSSASPWPRIADSGVFSSWLTESRNARSASRERSSSSAIWLNAAASAFTSSEPVTGSGSGRSPAASWRLASRRAAPAARPRPRAGTRRAPRAARADGRRDARTRSMNGRQSRLERRAAARSPGRRCGCAA